VTELDLAPEDLRAIERGNARRVFRLDEDAGSGR
jgi:hypothetical protein